MKTENKQKLEALYNAVIVKPIETEEVSYTARGFLCFGEDDRDGASK